LSWSLGTDKVESEVLLDEIEMSFMVDFRGYNNLLKCAQLDVRSQLQYEDHIIAVVPGCKLLEY
jgi:hypothetical protein